MKKATLILSSVFILVLAFGINTWAQECYTCPDLGNVISGNGASALGSNNTVNGSNSSAIGNNNTISSGSGIIAGTYSNISSSSGNSVIVGGANTIISGSQESYIFGSGSEVQHNRAMLIGHRLKSGSSNQIIIGAGDVGNFLTCNKTLSLAVGFKSNVPTFFVGESPSNVRTGRVGIGNNTDPQAKLHIKADASEDAILLLEATGTNKTSSFLLGGGAAIIGTTSNSNSLSLVTGNTNTRMFINGESGHVGIGSDEPQTRLQVSGGDIFIEDINRGIIMKSPDGNCWRGTLNNQGQMEFTLLPDCITVASEALPTNPGASIRIAPNPANGYFEIICSQDELTCFKTYTVYDMYGKQMLTGSLSGQQQRVNTAQLSSGTYLLTLTGNLQTWSDKVVVQ